MHEKIAEHWDPVPGFLNVASVGVPPRETVAAMRADLARWQAGAASPAEYDDAVDAARRAYARLVDVPVDRVAVGPQVSVLVGLVAASVRDGARVVVPEGEFTSVLFPFLVHADRGVTVRQVPLEHLADAVDRSVDVVAFSLAQSADGRLVDVAAVTQAARAAGALTVADVTQAAGWYPLDAGTFDVTAAGAYKWLCAPRGSAFLTVRDDVADRLRPVNAGWYAGRDPWASVYGPDMALAEDARRFDVSPAWPVWVGTAPAIEVYADLLRGDPEVAGLVRAHGAGLADRVRTGLGLTPTGLPVLALPDPDGALRAALQAAGCAVAARRGGVRMSFHLWNEDEDAERVLAALSPHVRAPG